MRGATSGVTLYLDNEIIGQSSSTNPGLSINGSTSVGLKANQKYKFRAEGRNTNATPDSTSMRGIIVITQ